MKKKIFLFLSVIVLFLSFSIIEAFAYDWSFYLTLPAGDAGPGEAVNLGYVIKNNETAYWLAVMSFEVDPWQNGEAQSLFDYPVMSPGEEVAGNLYKFIWNMDAPLGFINSGEFNVGADWYDNDPDIPGNYIATENLSQTYSTTCVPEPSTSMLFCAGILCLLGLYTQKQKTNNGNNLL